MIKDTLTNLRGIWLRQNDCRNIVCAIRAHSSPVSSQTLSQIWTEMDRFANRPTTLEPFHIFRANCTGGLYRESVSWTGRGIPSGPRKSLAARECLDSFIWQKGFLKSFCKVPLPHKSVNLSFTTTNMKNKSTDFCRNSLLINEFEKTLCEINTWAMPPGDIQPGSRTVLKLTR